MEKEWVPERQILGGVFSFLGNKKQQEVIIMALAAVLSSSPLTLPLLLFWPRPSLSNSWITSSLYHYKKPTGQLTVTSARGAAWSGSETLSPREKQNSRGLQRNKTNVPKDFVKNTEVKDIDTSTLKALLVLFHDTDISLVSFFPFLVVLLHYRQFCWKAPSSHHWNISPLSAHSFRSCSSRSTARSMSWHGKSHLSLKWSAQQPSITVLGTVLRS